MAYTTPGAAAVYLQKMSQAAGSDNQNAAEGIPKELFQLFSNCSANKSKGLVVGGGDLKRGGGSQK